LGKLIDSYDLKTLSPQLDQSWTLQEVVVDVLHPADRDIKRVVWKTNDTNNASVMLRITFAGRRVLLTADIGAKGWQWVAERKTDLQADVFKFPHHGAWYEAKDQQSSLAEILRQVNPSLVVLSVGTYNSKHPDPNTFSLLRSQPNLRFVCTEATWQCHNPLKSASSNIPCPCAGTVEVVIGNNQIKVTPDRATHAEVIKGFDTPQCKA